MVTRTGALGSVLAAPQRRPGSAAGRKQDDSEERRDQGGENQGPRPAYARKLQSFCPRKESGVPAAIAIACAGTLLIPAPSTKPISTA